VLGDAVVDGDRAPATGLAGLVDRDLKTVRLGGVASDAGLAASCTEHAVKLM